MSKHEFDLSTPGPDWLCLRFEDAAGKAALIQLGERVKGMLAEWERYEARQDVAGREASSMVYLTLPGTLRLLPDYQVSSS